MSVSTPSTEPGARAIVVDIQHELRWWREHYQQTGRGGFAQAEPTLKFAYDSYLLHPHERLHALWPDIHRRYALLPAHEQLGRAQAERIIAEVWQHIHGDAPAA
ncbi:hypothetical protein [Pseudoxanthomonas winnipegensis]|uniref:Uncharacterized protein n=1 Tax=Pseudoxanthomonas winnipegensis TaxID=2480810 RepID=A0A4Q8LTS8_9GAMM|nr:hypothetical protein [Pseudoxanthomonas winnipegensis]TAA35230.1 hypothetical protein EA655_19895 [Pseudoxanthomonas winnipegensis]